MKVGANAEIMGGGSEFCLCYVWEDGILLPHKPQNYSLLPPSPPPHPLIAHMLKK